jgi:hypothetical protein
MNKYLIIIIVIISVLMLTMDIYAGGARGGVGGRAGAAGGMGAGGRGGIATVTTQRPNKQTRLAAIAEIEQQIAALNASIQKAPATDPCIPKLQGEALTTFTNQYNEETNALNVIVTTLNNIRPAAGARGGGRGMGGGGGSLTAEQITELIALAKEDKVTKLVSRLENLAKEAAAQPARSGGMGGSGMGSGGGGNDTMAEYLLRTARYLLQEWGK